MTHLEQLIQDLCPNGVHWYSVNDLIKQKIVHTVSASIKLKRNQYLTEGTTPIISQEEEFISGYTNITDKNICQREYVCFGDHSEHIKYIDFAFVQGADGLKIMYCNQDALSAKYFYYTVSNFYKKHCNYERHFKYLQELQIPLPPLAVQSEIVRILDEFTLYKSELAAELAARLQQYEYYRDQLLTFDDTVKRVKLGEVGKMQYGYPFNASLFTDEKNDKPIIRIRDVVPAHANTYYNGNVDDLENYIIRRGDMLVGMDGYFNMAKWNDDNAYLNQRVCKISTANSKVVLDGFLFHFLKPTFKIIEQNTAGGSVIHLSAKVINNILIPLPPLSEQERIVSILDRFDKLCHDIREGLPAEIDLRQKQYEHYRDKLLTF